MSRRLILLFMLVGMVGLSSVPTTRSQPTNIMLTVNVGMERKPISPYIYGLNFVENAFAQEIDLPVLRWGGNHTTRYNWKLNAINHGNDWFFHNNQHYDFDSGNPITANQWVTRNFQNGADSIMTMPIMGYVAKDTNQNTCGFKVSIYGTQDVVDSGSGYANCGNGIHNGTKITGNNPLDTSIAITAAWASEWTTHLVQTHGAANAGGVKFYNLDNEPELWSETHRDAHPTPQSYDELTQKTIDYAAAIKSVDPNAQTLGFVSFGWWGYWNSQRDMVAGASNGYTYFPDYATHGNRYQVEYFLDTLHEYEQQHGTRLLDYLDLHFYPQNGVDLRDSGDAAMQALRLRSVRALWDANYRDESVIGSNDFPVDRRYVRLIPRMREWVNAHYSGTKLAITEYNWGGLEHINGAVAQADILGIFGREGLDLATLFNYPDPNLGTDQFENQPAAYAFRMFRNYDGNTSKFGDTSVQASSSDQGSLSIYAAERSSDNALTLMIINKTSVAQTADLSLIGFIPQNPTASVYQYSDANLNAIVRASDITLEPLGFSSTFPANSITLIEIDGASVPLQKTFVPLVQN